MKVVIINTSECNGGAAVAANRLLKALTAKIPNLEATMLVRDQTNDDPRVISINTTAYKRLLNKIRFVWERAIIFFANKFNRCGLFQVSIANTGTDISRLPVVREADIIHLHWINQGFLSLRDLRNLQRLGKPIVWTLHDLWPATGICHYPDTCTHYRTQCDKCPQMASAPLLPLSRRVFKKKMRLNFSRTTFVGCSQWITNMAQTSRLLQQARFHSIPNPIDGTVFYPINRIEVRQRFLLPTDRPIVLFAAAKVSDTRKGIKYLIEACRLLYRQGLQSFDVALLGGQPEGLTASFPCRVHSLGYLSAPEDIRAAYACASVFVIPSLEDNLPNTVMEALACGTPCVGFRTGGIPEMIDHLQNGYIARYQDAQDLADGIAWVLNHPAPEALSDACLQKVDHCYRPDVVARQYKALYQSLIPNFNLCRV